jgi:hypothetical protein
MSPGRKADGGVHYMEASHQMETYKKKKKNKGPPADGGSLADVATHKDADKNPI